MQHTRYDIHYYFQALIRGVFLGSNLVIVAKVLANIVCSYPSLMGNKTFHPGTFHPKCVLEIYLGVYVKLGFDGFS